MPKIDPFAEYKYVLSNFTKEGDGGSYKCNECNETGFTPGGRLSNAARGRMGSHLKTKHTDLSFDKWKADKLAQNQKEWDAKVRAFNNQTTREDSVAKEIPAVRWMSRHGVPYSALRDPDYKAIVKGSARLPQSEERYKHVVSVYACTLRSEVIALSKANVSTLLLDGGKTNSFKSIAVGVQPGGGRAKDLAIVPKEGFVDEDDTTHSEDSAKGMFEAVWPIVENLNIIAVCTDNAANVLRLSEMLCEKYGAVHVGCTLHNLQLAISDSIKSRVERAKIDQAPSWKRCPETRWWGCITSVVKVHSVEKPKPLADQELILACETVLKEFAPAFFAGKCLEQETCDIHTAANLWFALMTTTGDAVVRRRLYERAVHICLPAFLLAAISSPLFQTADVKETNQTSRIKDWLATSTIGKRAFSVAAKMARQDNPEWIKQLRFNINEWLTRANKEGLAKDTTVKEFWVSDIAENVPYLAETVRLLGAIVLNEAHCERMFSRLGAAHTKARNRLSAKRCSDECIVRASTVGRYKKPRKDRELPALPVPAADDDDVLLIDMLAPTAQPTEQLEDADERAENEEQEAEALMENVTAHIPLMKHLHEQLVASNAVFTGAPGQFISRDAAAWWVRLAMYHERFTLVGQLLEKKVRNLKLSVYGAAFGSPTLPNGVEAIPVAMRLQGGWRIECSQHPPIYFGDFQHFKVNAGPIKDMQTAETRN